MLEGFEEILEILEDSFKCGVELMRGATIADILGACLFVIIFFLVGVLV